MRYFQLTIFLTIFISSCTDDGIGQNVETADSVKTKVKQGQPNADNSKDLVNQNIFFFADSLLKCDRTLIQTLVNKYQNDSCKILTYKTDALKSEYEGIRTVPDINGNKIKDSVFVLPPFNLCNDGQSYYFFDKTIPRLPTDSYCCHPDNLFVVQDIDEDGIKEIGIFYSSCASRYKSLKIFTLKNGEWKEIATSDFDVMTKDPGTVKFESLVKKTSKGEFKICNFIDEQTKWETVKMK